jgi:ABC-2 type transport system permease protein
MDVLSVGFVHPVVQILLCIWAVGRATGAIAGELDRGTMELLLAQPVPRGRVIIAHLLVDLMLIPLMSMSLWAGVAAGYEMTGPFTLNPDDLKQLPFAIRDIDPDWLAVHVRPFGAACINVAALLFAMSGLSMALSAHGRFRGRVNGQAAGLFIGMFAVNVIGQIWESASFLRPFTLFYYFQPQQVILRGNWWVSLSPIGLGIEVPLVLVLGLAGAAGYFEAWRCFTRRDLPAPL